MFVRKISAVSAAIAASAALLASPTLAQRLPIVVPVNCLLGQSINTVIETSSLLAKLEIQLLSSCNENITVTRDDVTIRGIPGTRTVTLTGGISATTVSRLYIQDMTIQNGSGIGVRAFNNSTIELSNVLLTGHPVAAASAIQQSQLTIRNSRLVGMPGSRAAIYAYSSGIDAHNTEFISTAATPNSGAAVALYRLSNAKITGNSTVINTNDSVSPDRALAVYAIDGSNFTASGGITFDGNTTLRNSAMFHISGFGVTGNMLAFNGSVAILRNGAGVDGSAEVSFLSRLYLPTGAGSITGQVSCTLEGRVRDETGALTPQGCPPLL